MTQFNRQEAFDKAARGVIKQGKPALDDLGMCVYRAADGCKCAVGHLIPEDAGDDVFRVRGGVTTLFGRTGIDDRMGIKEHLDVYFLEAMQQAHDSCPRLVEPAVFRSIYIKKMLGVAASYGLNPAVLDQPIPA